MTRTRKGEQTRARLLDAAREALIEGGGDLAQADVAARAGVSAGAPYRYFASKNQMIVAVVEAFFDELEAVAYQPTFEDEAEGWWPREQIRVQRFVEFFFESPLATIIARGLAGDAEVAQTIRRRLDKQCKGAALNVERGQSLGVVPAEVDPVMTGALLMGGMYQALHQALARGARDLPRFTLQCQNYMARVLGLETHDG